MSSFVTLLGSIHPKTVAAEDAFLQIAELARSCEGAGPCGEPAIALLKVTWGSPGGLPQTVQAGWFCADCLPIT